MRDLVPEPEEVSSSTGQSVGETIRGRFDDESPGTRNLLWATLTEAAALAGVSSSTIRRAVKAGTIRGQRAGVSQNSPWLVRLEDVEARWGENPPVESDAGEHAVKSEAEVEDAQGRLGELRERLVISEPERRWWQPKT